MKIKSTRYWRTHFETGDRIELGGDVFVVVQDYSGICLGCCFDHRDEGMEQHCSKPKTGFGACSREERKDHTDVIFLKM